MEVLFTLVAERCERVAGILLQDITSQNPILDTPLSDGSRVAVVGSTSFINARRIRFGNSIAGFARMS